MPAALLFCLFHKSHLWLPWDLHFVLIAVILCHYESSTISLQKFTLLRCGDYHKKDQTASFICCRRCLEILNEKKKTFFFVCAAYATEVLKRNKVSRFWNIFHRDRSFWSEHDDSLYYILHKKKIRTDQQFLR